MSNRTRFDLPLLPVPLCLLAIVTLWVMDLQVVWPSPALNFFVHYGSAAMGIVLIVVPAAIAFLANGQASILMLGCGMMIVEVGVLAMPASFTHSTSAAFAIYNTSALLSAFCQFAGVSFSTRFKTPVARPGMWLTFAYAGGAAVMLVVIRAALAGAMPAFFIEGHGGTLLRTLVVSAAAALFAMTAALLWRTHRRAPSPFLYWYALGLVLLSAGLAGSILISVKDSPLQWVTRFTQFFGAVYMCVAMLTVVRAGGTRTNPLEAVEGAWRPDDWLSGDQQRTPLGRALRFGLAVVAVALGFLLRRTIEHWTGPGLPTFITFYPAVMLVSLLAGFWPGIVATVATVLVVDYFILEPIGSFAVTDLVDIVGQFFFAGMGVLMSAVAGLYRRIRSNLGNLVEERTRELQDANAALKQQVELVDPARADVIMQEMQRVVRARRDAIASPARGVIAGDWLQRAATTAGVVAAVMGLVVLIGWSFDLSYFRSFLPGLATMKANTALCFLLAGVALVLRERRMVRWVCAAIVFGIAAVTVLEYACGADLVIDQLIFPDPGNPQTIHPGRMVVATAVGFLLSAGSLLLLGMRTRAVRWLQQSLASMCLVLGAIAILGYIYEVQQLYNFAGRASMALNTAIGFIVLSVGLIFARPDGLGRILVAPGPGAQVARRLLPAAILLPLFLGWLHELGEKVGIFPPTVGAGLLSLFMMLSFVVTIWWIAQTLDRNDASRRDTETQLRNQAELMDHSQDALIVREMNGAVRFWNNGAVALYGWPAAAAMGQRIHVLLRTEGLPPEHEARLEQTGHWEGELVHTARDGRRVTVESRKTAVRDAEGRLLVLESNRDITERKAAEEALRKSEEQNRLLAEYLALSSQPFGVGNPDGSLGYINSAFERLTGYTRDELKAIDWAATLTPPEWRSVESAKLEELHRTGEPVRYEKEYLRKDGARVPIELLVHLVKDDQGRPLQYFSFITDLTERKQAERALRESEDRLRFALETIRTGAWDLNLVDRTAYRSLEHDRIFGYAELLPQWTYEIFLDHILPEERPAVDGKFRAAMETQGDWNFECRIRRADGQTRWILAAGRHRPDATGAPRRMAGIVQDITERKEAEEALREASERDAFRVALGEALRPLSDAQEIKVAAARLLGQYLRASRVAYAEITPEGDVIMGRGYTDGVPDIAGRYRLADYGPSLLNGIQAGRNIVVADVASDPIFTQEEKARYRALQVAGNLNVPLVKEGRTVALLAVNQAAPRHWTDKEVSLVEETVERTWSTMERARAEAAVRESESRVRRKLDSVLSPEGDLGTLELSDIIDVPALQKLMDHFFHLAHFPMTIMDLKGKVLVGVGWQDICMRFHRAHPDACRNCVESDLQLTAGVPPGEAKLYKCKNNMWDIATPILVGGRHVGNLFSGQFFFDDEKPDVDLFRAQARQYGFKEDEYIAAMEAVPRFTRATVDTGMAFLMKLAEILSHLSYGNIKLARFLAERDSLLASVRESEERLKRAQEISHLGSWDLDLVNNRLSWSDEVYRIFGLQPQEFGATYEAFLERVHPDDRDAVNEAYSSSLRESRDKYEIDHRVVRKDTDEVRVVHEKCEHFRDGDGKIIRSVGMVHDITERKKAEEEIRRVNENLEQFAYVASHDLQEPLRIMSSYSQLLEKRYKNKLDQDADEFIHYIVDAAARMQKLITDSLAYSRAGHKGAALAEVDCNQVVRRVVNTLGATIQAAGGSVTFSDLPVILAHEGSMIQLFQNLIANAVKFRGEASPKIEVSATQSDREWVFAVHDNGIGIEPQYFDRIFVIFQRLHAREKYAGTGIGLSICKKIVENLGGRIWVESEFGKGTTFYFTVPAAR